METTIAQKTTEICTTIPFFTADFDQERLRDVLKDIKGRFLLSYDDSPKVRELYKGYEMIEVKRQNGINNREGANKLNKIYKELLIANYPI